MTQQEDITYRLKKYTEHFLETFSRMYRLREPDESMVELYADRFKGVHLSHLVNSFDICYEQFKDAGRYPSPDEILIHVADERRLIGNQQSGPLEVFEGNRQMLQIFIKAFRESNLKGKDLEDYLNKVVEENYDRLCEPKIVKCRQCKDRGWIRGWFVHFPGKKDVWQKDATGKSRAFVELNRVPNSPIWVQDDRPEFNPPEGQMLSDGIFNCECSMADLWSFPKLNEAA